MKKKWWIITASLLVGVALVLAILAMLPPQPGVSKENFDRIEEGMTRAQVEVILGKATAVGWGRLAVGPTWENDNGDEIWIGFDENERVTTRQFHPSWWPDERTTIEKLLDRLPWREKTPRPPRRRIITAY